MADASSNSISVVTKHDVFISFRGEDTRKSITSYLCAALSQKKIKTYIDEDYLRKGDEISPALLKAIQESKISVIILSQNYASSSWCLDELTHILLCKEIYKQIVVPVFYNVDPSHIRKQQGSYAVAFAAHEERFKDKLDKLLQWKNALTKVAGLSGWDSSVFESEAKLVEAILRDILQKLSNISATHDDLEGLIGIDKRIQKIELLLNTGSSDVRIISLWGMGGIGKTTLARVIFNQIAHQFDSCCFLQNVREESEKLGLTSLQKKLFSQLLEEECLDTVNEFVMDRLRRTKVLIVLDDVNDEDQLEYLAGDRDWFSHGSRIIITSRDMQVLKNTGVDETYKVEELNSYEALQLFNSKSVPQNSSTEDYVALAERAVNYAKGIPLALKILCHHIFSKNTKEWEREPSKLLEFPYKKVHNVLKISYDGLDENAQCTFLDIAFFFKGEDQDFVKGILGANGIFVDTGIRDLTDKCLLTITHEKFEMHDLHQQMGFEIVRQESKEPGRRSRLCLTEDVSRVLRYNRFQGTPEIQGMSMNMSELGDAMHLKPTVFKEMYNLKLLKFIQSFGNTNKLYLPQGLESLPNELRYLCWDYYPLPSLPPGFTAQNLVELHLCNSQLQHLCDEVQHFGSLKVLNLERSQNLTQIPDLSPAIRLEKMNLKDCIRLKNLPSSIGMLESLQSLDLSGCSDIVRLPELPQNIKLLNASKTTIKEVSPTIKYLSQLERLDLSGCSDIVRLPELPQNIKYLNVSKTAILEVPPTIKYLPQLEALHLSGCADIFRLAELPRNIKSLSVSGTEIEEVPQTVENLVGLQTFYLQCCNSLQTLPTSIHKLKSLRALYLNDCPELELESLEPPLSTDLLLLNELTVENTSTRNVPDWIFSLPSLTSLNISRTEITTLPASLKNSKLHRLFIRGCNLLRSLPELPVSLTFLDAQRCTSLEKLAFSRIEQAPQVPDQNNNRLERLIFDYCLKLGCGNIMNEFLSRAVRAASRLAKEIQFQGTCRHRQVIISFPGNEIPQWFNHQNEGCFVNMKLPPHWYSTNFTGFAACIVLSWDYSGKIARDSMFQLQCEMCVKTNYGRWCFNRSDPLHPVGDDPSLHHVFLWSFYENDIESSAEEILFRFSAVYDTSCNQKSSFEVKSCGIHMLSPEDAAGSGFLSGEANVVIDEHESSRLLTTNLNILEPLSKKLKR